MRPWCLLFVSVFAFAPTVPRAAEPPRPAKPPWELDSWEHRMVIHRLNEVGELLLAHGKYRAALIAFTDWEDMSDCGNSADWFNAEKPYRLALCHAHLNDHEAAARECLSAASDQYMRPYEFAEFLVQLYREAGQLNDLHALLDTIDRMTTENRLAVGDTPKQVRQHLKYECSGTNLVRRVLKAEELAKLAPWPAAMPKPKPGSLPKAL